jgi:Ulp1 family protease
MCFNDSLIDLRMKSLLTQMPEDYQHLLHAFSTMFYTKMYKEGHAAMSTWTKRFDVFQKDFIFIPVNGSGHWSLAVIAHPKYIAVSSLSLPLLCSTVVMCRHRFDFSIYRCFPLSSKRNQISTVIREFRSTKRNTRPAYYIWILAPPSITSTKYAIC